MFNAWEFHNLNREIGSIYKKSIAPPLWFLAYILLSQTGVCTEY